MTLFTSRSYSISFRTLAEFVGDGSHSQLYWCSLSDVFVSIRQTIIHVVGKGKKDWAIP